MLALCCRLKKLKRLHTQCNNSQPPGIKEGFLGQESGIINTNYLKDKDCPRKRNTLDTFK
jgi:hypothetical protein